MALANPCRLGRTSLPTSQQRGPNPVRRPKAVSPPRVERLEDRRLLNAADLDTTFGGDGIVTTDIDGGVDWGAVVAQPDGKVVIAGFDGGLNNGDVAVVRYHSDGSLDASFGGDGIVTLNLGYTDLAYSVALQADGKIVVGVQTYLLNGPTGSDFAVARYNTDGTLDTSFDSDGVVITDLGGEDEAWSIAVQGDGKILLGGDSDGGNALVRYNTDGSLDTSFDSDGIVVTDLDSATGVFTPVVVQPDGNILMAGRNALIRYTSSGSLDTSFSSDGIVSGVSGSSLALQSDGKILMAGEIQAINDFSVMRFNSDGSFDTTFGIGGIATTDLGYQSDRSWSVAVQADGRILLAGEVRSSDSTDYVAVVRYNANGSLDTEFGPQGAVVTDLGGREQVLSMALQPDGRILVGGTTSIGTNESFAVVRYLGTPITKANIGSFSISVSDPIETGGSNALSANFTDPDPGETHTALYDWGDGSTSAGTVTEQDGDDPGTVSGSHEYTAPGVYSVTLTVTDSGGAVSTAVYEQYVVVYDPTGGFVTGGGQIQSPAGAYALDPDLSGPASFGFVSKYQKGATTPVGETQFVFNVGDLDFESTSYDWLVISGANRAQFKGSGTINGSGDYGFLVTVIDGGKNGVDKFRIKIWDKTTDMIIYDNQLGDPDGAALATTLSGGSILIHAK